MERQEDCVRIGFHTCEDMLGKLEREGQRLLASHDADDVMNFCMTGHHLLEDWLRWSGSDVMRKRHKMITGDAKAVIQILYDISNGSKHFRLTREKSIKARVLDKSYAEPIDDWWKYFFAPTFNYETKDLGLNHEQFVSQVIGYLAWIVRGPGDTIPQNLLAELEQLRKSQDANGNDKDPSPDPCKS